jgi:hypothetical protein
MIIFSSDSEAPKNSLDYLFHSSLSLIREYLLSMSYLSFILVVLTACSPIDFPSGNQFINDVELNENKITDVRVELVQGPALPMAKLLTSAIATALLENGVTTSVKPDELSRFVLKGLAKANWEGRQVPFVVLIDWTLYDLTGKAIGTYTQGVRGARWKWEFGDPRIISAVGYGAAKPLAAMILEEEKNPLPNLLLGTGVFVKPVTGAPGDGNESLRIAIVRVMRISGIKVAEDIRQASLTLTGHVSLKPSGYGLDEVLVTWRVQTMDGSEVGRATQANNILSGKLDRLWGDEAEKIAEAALIGIDRIIGLGITKSLQSINDTNGQSVPTLNLE